MQCHDPHQSAKPKLMQAFVHNPFENKMCDSCHAAPKDGKVVLTNADTRALCVTCHGDQAEKIENAKVQHPGAQGDCTSCHNPHAGKTPGFLQPDPVQACLACHSDQSDQMKKAHLHQPAFRQVARLATSLTAETTNTCCGRAAPTSSVSSVTVPIQTRRKWTERHW